MAGTGQPVYVAAAGTKLKYGAATASPTLAQFSGIRMFGGLPESTVDQFETTQIDAVLTDGTTPDMEKYYGFGKSDNGTLMYTIAQLDASIVNIYSIKGVLKTWQVVFSSGSTKTFLGAINKIKPSVDAKGEVLYEISIKVSGGIVYAAAGGSRAVRKADPAAVSIADDRMREIIDQAVAYALSQLAAASKLTGEPVESAKVEEVTPVEAAKVEEVTPVEAAKVEEATPVEAAKVEEAAPVEAAK